MNKGPAGSRPGRKTESVWQAHAMSHTACLWLPPRMKVHRLGKPSGIPILPVSSFPTVVTEQCKSASQKAGAAHRSENMLLVLQEKSTLGANKKQMLVLPLPISFDYFSLFIPMLIAALFIERKHLLLKVSLAFIIMEFQVFSHLCVQFSAL